MNNAPSGIIRAAIAPTTRGLSMAGTSGGRATVRTGYPRGPAIYDFEFLTKICV